MHLGQLPVTFTLQVKTELGKKAGKKQSGPVRDKDSTVEFVVGPGATFKQRKQQRSGTSTSPKPITAISSLKKFSGERGRALQQPVSLLMEEEVTESSPGPTHSEKGSAQPPPMGRHQRGVISELLVKGAKLRDKMVGSLAMGTRRLHDQLGYAMHPSHTHEEGPTEELATPGVLSLMSAELALKEQGQGAAGRTGKCKVDLLYNELSSSEDGESSAVSSGSMEEVPPHQGLPPGPEPLLLLQGGPKQQFPTTFKPHSPSQTQMPSSNQVQSKKRSPQGTRGQTALQNAAKRKSSLCRASKSKSLPRRGSRRKPVQSGSTTKSPLQEPSAQQEVPKEWPPQDRADEAVLQDASNLLVEGAESPGEGSGAESALQEEEEEEGGEESGSSDQEECAPAEQIQMKRGRIASASLRDLLAQFGQSEVPSEQEMSRTMGVEQLTRLGRATSARVIVDTLHLEPVALEKIISHKYRPVEGKGTGPALR